MKKRTVSLVLTLLLLVGSLWGFTAHAAGSLSAKASASSVTVGSSVTVTLQYSGGGAPIGSIDATFHYNADAFQYVSCSGAEVGGGAGKVQLSWFGSGLTGPSSVTITLTLKAKAPGAGNFSVSTSEFINDNDYSSLGNPGASIAVSAVNPTLSSNANLASLKPSSGTLTPAFKAATTSYTIEVPYTTTSLSLSATPAVSGAKVSVAGSNTLAVGKNTQTVTVTAPSGATKKYTVVITRAAQQINNSNPSSGDSTTTTTTAPPPDDHPLEVEVNGKLMTVVDTQPNVTLPDGYEWTSVPFHDMQVSAAQNTRAGLTLLYLHSETGDGDSFYIYDAEKGQFALFRPVTVAGGVYVLREMPAEMTAPAGTAAAQATIGEQTVTAWQYEDAAQADFLVVYATAPNGNTGLYVYDKTDGSLQRYRELALPAETVPAEEPPQGNAFTRFITAHKTVILIGEAAVGVLILVIIALIRLFHRPRNCAH